MAIRNLMSQVAEFVQRLMAMLKILYFSGSTVFFQISLGWEFPNFIGDGISKPVFPNFKCGGGII